MKGLELKSFPFEMKSETVGPDGGATIEGIVACFLNIDLCGDMYVPGCFTEQLPFFKSEGVIRDEHCVTTGKIDDAAEVAGGLWFKGTIFPTTAGRDQAILVKNKAIRRLSIGARNYGRWCDELDEIKSIWTKHGYTPTEQDLVRVGYGVRVIDKAKPFEASTTWLPMNEATQITSVKSEGGPLARPTFDEHSARALATVEEFAQRAAQLAALREEKGRGLSAKSRARINQLQGQLAQLAALPEAKAIPSSPADGDQLEAEFLRVCAHLEGAPV